MGFLRLETSKANYVLHFEHHSKEYDLSGLDVDAWVLEGTGKYNKVDYTSFARDTSKQLSTSLKKPHYMGDRPHERITGGKRTIAGIAAMIAEPALAVPLAPSILAWAASARALNRKGEIKKRQFLIVPMAKLAIFLRGLEATRFREALLAEKAEKAIAPELAKKLGRKPTIGITMGSVHTGIVKMLENPNARRRALSKLNWRKRTSEADMGRVFEVRINKNGDLETRLFEKGVRLPKFRPLKQRLRAYGRLARKKTTKKPRRRTRK